MRLKQTTYEQKLWDKIKRKQLLNVQFYRQKILLNRYIVDFYAPSVKLVVEVDGFHHNLTEHQEYDQLRDQELTAINLTIKRYSNMMVSNNFGHVIKDLHNYIWHKLHDTSISNRN